jgi:hypothetical protein
MAKVVAFPGASFPDIQPEQVQDLAELKVEQTAKLRGHMESVLKDWREGAWGPDPTIITILCHDGATETTITRLGEGWDVAGLMLGIERAKHTLLTSPGINTSDED